MSAATTSLMLGLLLLAIAGFALGLWALGSRLDLLGVLMSGVGALALRAAWLAAREAERGGT
jgi:hypothetical protein